MARNSVPPDNVDTWLTVRDAAKLSDYDPEHIRRLVRENKVKARKFSIVWMVSRESLLAYMAMAQAMGNKRGRKPEKQLQ